MGAQAPPRLGVAEYLELDERAERKCEYHDGELFPIVDASDAHATIGFNLIGVLGHR